MCTSVPASRPGICMLYMCVSRLCTCARVYGVCVGGGGGGGGIYMMLVIIEKFLIGV